MRARTLALLFLLLGAGCGIFSLGPKKSPLQEKVGGSKMSAAELRERVRALALPFSGQLETMADAVASTTNDPAQRRALLEFKINAIPQMQDALLRPDPVASLVDAWALVLQLRDAMTRIPGLQLPPEVGASFDGMENQLASLWQQMTGRENVSGARELVGRWAAAHPLESLAVRPTTEALLASVTAREGLTPLQAAGELIETTEDVIQRIDVQSAFLPKQGRWQAELLMRQALADPSLFGGSPQRQEQLLASLGQAMQTAATAPGWTQAELRLALGALHDERLEAQGFVQGERDVLLRALHGERVAALEQADQIGAQLVDRAFVRADALVDRVLLRLLIFAAILAVGFVILALLLLRRWDRRGRLETRRRPAEV